MRGSADGALRSQVSSLLGCKGSLCWVLRPGMCTWKLSGMVEVVKPSQMSCIQGCWI